MNEHDEEVLLYFIKEIVYLQIITAKWSLALSQCFVGLNRFEI